MGENTSLPDNQDEIDAACHDLMVKNAELRQIYNYLKIENRDYNEKYKFLKDNLNSVTQFLEKNVDLFQQIFGEVNCDLQIARIPSELLYSNKLKFLVAIHSPDVEKKQRKLETKSTQAGPVSFSGNLQFCSTEAQVIEAVVPSTSIEEHEEGSLQHENLTVITEENSTDLRQLSIRLKRLSPQALSSHLDTNVTKTNGVEESFNVEALHPDFTSTPLKLETMGSLGLMPSPKGVYKNICVRRKVSERLSRSLKQEFASPDKKLPAIKEKPARSSRPGRKAKPTSLKEESLRKKKRRN